VGVTAAVLAHPLHTYSKARRLQEGSAYRCKHINLGYIGCRRHGWAGIAASRSVTGVTLAARATVCFLLRAQSSGYTPRGYLCAMQPRQTSLSNRSQRPKDDTTCVCPL
jgi:hypothetical protein